MAGPPRRGCRPYPTSPRRPRRSSTYRMGDSVGHRWRRRPPRAADGRTARPTGSRGSTDGQPQPNGGTTCCPCRQPRHRTGERDPDPQRDRATTLRTRRGPTGSMTVGGGVTGNTPSFGVGIQGSIPCPPATRTVGRRARRGLSRSSASRRDHGVDREAPPEVSRGWRSRRGTWRLSAGASPSTSAAWRSTSPTRGRRYEMDMTAPRSTSPTPTPTPRAAWLGASPSRAPAPRRGWSAPGPRPRPAPKPAGRLSGTGRG